MLVVVLEGLLKHKTAYDAPELDANFTARSSSLEAQVANLADEIAYYSHDLDDGLEAGLVDETHLAANVRIWRDASECVRKEFGDLPDESHRYYTIRCIIDEQVKDVVCTSEAAIRKAKVQTAGV